MIDLSCLESITLENLKGLTWSRLHGSFSINLFFREGHVCVNSKGVTFSGSISDELIKGIKHVCSEVCC